MKPIDWHSMIIRWSAVASAWERGPGLPLSWSRTSDEDLSRGEG
jgi:hypothetical protein